MENKKCITCERLVVGSKRHCTCDGEERVRKMVMEQMVLRSKGGAFG